MKSDKPPGFIETPEAQSQFRKWFYIFLCILLVIDLSTWFLFERQGHFAWEDVPFFYAVYGFISCVGLIFIARILRCIVKKKEGYYD